MSFFKLLLGYGTQFLIKLRYKLINLNKCSRHIFIKYYLRYDFTSVSTLNSIQKLLRLNKQIPTLVWYFNDILSTFNVLLMDFRPRGPLSLPTDWNRTGLKIEFKFPLTPKRAHRNIFNYAAVAVLKFKIVRRLYGIITKKNNDPWTFTELTTLSKFC